MVKNLIAVKSARRTGEAFLLSCFLALALLSAGAVGSGKGTAQGFTQQLALGRESRLWLEGDSTIHSYSSTATLLTAAIEMESAQSAAEVVRNEKLKKLEIHIPVRGLKSGKSGLDKNMRAALKAEQFPHITFRLSKYEVVDFSQQKGDFLIRATGDLSLAGTVKSIVLETKGQLSNSGFRVWGHKAVLMTEFGVEPPVLMFGAIKTDNKITIYFDLSFDSVENARIR